MSAETKIREFVERLIAEGDAVLNSRWQDENDRPRYPWYVDLEKFEQWRGRCRLLLSKLGSLSAPWDPVLGTETHNGLNEATSVHGALKGIQQSLQEGLLVRFEDLVLAEAFSDLFEQADYLFQQGYFLAGAVVGRAVLEERLRRLCTAHGCLPARDRPTLGDFNSELYKHTIYDKITFKHVDALAAVGNDAAHNNPSLKKEDVRRFLDGVADILRRFSA